MTSFTFSVEQLRAAPIEVRRWVEGELAAAAALIHGPAHEPGVHAAALAACTAEEAMQLFELIKGDFLLTQVFFELARELHGGRAQTPLYALDVGDMLRHTRLPDGDRLADYLTAINQAFQRVRNDPEASLFGFDEYGHVYIHETTHKSVRRLWERLLAPQAQAAGFEAPYVGPSEPVAGHAPSPGKLAF